MTTGMTDEQSKCHHAYRAWQMAESRERDWDHALCIERRHTYMVLARAYRDEHGREWHELSSNTTE